MAGMKVRESVYMDSELAGWLEHVLDMYAMGRLAAREEGTHCWGQRVEFWSAEKKAEFCAQVKESFMDNLCKWFEPKKV